MFKEERKRFDKELDDVKSEINRYKGEINSIKEENKVTKETMAATLSEFLIGAVASTSQTGWRADM